MEGVEDCWSFRKISQSITELTPESPRASRDCYGFCYVYEHPTGVAVQGLESSACCRHSGHWASSYLEREQWNDSQGHLTFLQLCFPAEKISLWFSFPILSIMQMHLIGEIFFFFPAERWKHLHHRIWANNTHRALPSPYPTELVFKH